MKIGRIADRLNQIDTKRSEWIASHLTGMDKELKIMQEKLLNLILSDYVGKFKRGSDGRLLYNAFNVNLANEMEAVFDKFNVLFHDNYLKSWAMEALNVTQFTADYYKGMGIAASTVESMMQQLEFLKPSIGIEVGKTVETSKIIPGSYLDKLSQSDSVRLEVKDYILQNIAGKSDYQSYVSGFKDLIVGNDEIEGRLQRYYRQYAYDTYNEVESSADLYLADNLELEYFIYEGDVVDKSRPFCEERYGKVFSRKDIERWREMDWKGKNKDVPFEISRGGYNCRHRINWITAELAQYYGYEV